MPIELPKTTRRVAFCDRATGSGGVDGVWWLIGDDLCTELPDLLEVVGSMIGPVRRVVYDPKAWPRTGSRVILHGRVVSVNPYPLVCRQSLYLVGTHTRDMVLYVLPRTCATAASVLQVVSRATAPVTAAAVRSLVEQRAEPVSRRADLHAPR